MSPETQQLTSKALSLIEQSRYRMGTSRFVEAFIDQWAYLQTGLYPAKEEIGRTSAGRLRALSRPVCRH